MQISGIFPSIIIELTILILTAVLVTINHLINRESIFRAHIRRTRHQRISRSPWDAEISIGIRADGILIGSRTQRGRINNWRCTRSGVRVFEREARVGTPRAPEANAHACVSMTRGITLV